MRVLDDWWLTPERVALHLPSRTAVVADLHLGYQEARQRSGEMVPSPPLSSVLAPLAACMDRHQATRLIIAGDLVESRSCTTALKDFRDWISARRIRLTAFIPGNHDPEEGLADFALSPDGYWLEHWLIVHGDRALPGQPLVQGHVHPSFRWPGRFCTAQAPCYLVGDQHLVLPAYSAEASGVNVLGQHCWRSHGCHVIANDQVLDLGPLGTLRARLGHRASK